jgi:hypothetical protein
VLSSEVLTCGREGVDDSLHKHQPIGAKPLGTGHLHLGLEGHCERSDDVVFHSKTLTLATAQLREATAEHSVGGNVGSRHACMDYELQIYVLASMIYNAGGGKQVSSIDL